MSCLTSNYPLSVSELRIYVPSPAFFHSTLLLLIIIITYYYLKRKEDIFSSLAVHLERENISSLFYFLLKKMLPMLKAPLNSYFMDTQKA